MVLNVLCDGGHELVTAEKNWKKIAKTLGKDSPRRRGPSRSARTTSGACLTSRTGLGELDTLGPRPESFDDASDASGRRRERAGAPRRRGAADDAMDADGASDAAEEDGYADSDDAKSVGDDKEDKEAGGPAEEPEEGPGGTRRLTRRRERERRRRERRGLRAGDEVMRVPVDSEAEKNMRIT